MGPKPKPNDPVSVGYKMKHFAVAHWRGLIIIIIPIIGLFTLGLPNVQPYNTVAYSLWIMAWFWMTECIPLPITGFVPIILFPFLDVLSTLETCRVYINSTVMMFLGSLILSTSIEQPGLHRRLALNVVKSIGYSHYKLLFAMGFVTMFMSMWLVNTAATSMMLPINIALLQVFEDQGLLKIFERSPDGDVAGPLTAAYFCSSTFSATIGGIGTLIGTGTNLVFKGLFETEFPEAPEYLSFLKFSAFSIPYMIVLQLFNYFGIIFLYFGFLRPNSSAAQRIKVPMSAKKAASTVINKRIADLGRMSYWEYNVFALFMFAIALLICRSPQVFSGWADKLHKTYEVEGLIKDSVAMPLAYSLMMLLPRNLSFFKNFSAKTKETLPNKPIKNVLDWNAMDVVQPWSFMFLLGGGFAISTAASNRYTDLNGKIGEMLRKLDFLPNFSLVFVVIIFTTLLTNLASNIAVCNVIAPIGMTLAIKVGANPLQYNIAAGFCSSYCFLLPVGTPGNLLVQGFAKVTTKEMIKAGSIITVASMFLSWFAIMVWAPIIWPDLKKSAKDLPWVPT